MEPIIHASGRPSIRNKTPPAAPMARVKTIFPGTAALSAQS
jgi:hypothetical protein